MSMTMDEGIVPHMTFSFQKSNGRFVYLNWEGNSEEFI